MLSFPKQRIGNTSVPLNSQAHQNYIGTPKGGFCHTSKTVLRVVQIQLNSHCQEDHQLHDERKPALELFDFPPADVVGFSKMMGEKTK